ncbi:MAG TPA: thiopeptide-type bacteriocin biosynthesis protein [Candidatus Elarobacter sp.]|nr:thiopeptide-type bacteriocin biosynthesis protein [Candidatus Elarobacter sp.]
MSIRIRLLPDTVLVRMPLGDQRSFLEAFGPDAATFVWRNVTRDNYLTAALSVASPDLVAAIERADGAGTRSEKLLLKATEYLVRASTKATPFGLFSAVGRARFTQDPCDMQATRPHFRTVGRLRPAPLYGAITDFIQRQPFDGAILFANPQVIERGDRLLIFEPNPISQPDHDVQSNALMRSIRNTAAVRFVRDRTDGGIVAAVLVDELVERFGIGPASARNFVSDVKGVGLIVPGPVPSPYDTAASYRDTVPSDWNIRDELASFDRNVQRIARIADDHVAGRMPHAALRGALESTGHVVDLEAILEGTVSLPDRLIDDVALLGRLAWYTARTVRQEKLRRTFSTYFEGSERAVPLLEFAEADSPFGIPEWEYESPAQEKELTREISSIAAAALAERRIEHAVSEEAVRRRFGLGDQPSLDTSSFEVAFRLIRPSNGVAGDYRIVSVEYPSGLAEKSIGRSNDVIPRMTPVGDGDGPIVAELVYLPPNRRLSTFLPRRPTAPYQIVIGAGISANQRPCIEVGDLAVRMLDGNLALWCVSRQRRVVIIEPSMFNSILMAPHIARVALAVAHDGSRAVNGFYWPGLAELPFVPRLRVGNVIVKPASWRFTAADIKRFAGDAWAHRRDVWMMPRYVHVTSQNDEPFFLDLDSALANAMLADFARRVPDGQWVTIREVVPGHSELGELHRPFDEYLASFEVHSAIKARTGWPKVFPRSDFSAHPRMPLAYAELYCRRSAQDGLLLESIRPFVDQLSASGTAAGWFFVRYAAPNDHLRLRILPKPGQEKAAREALETLADSLLASRQITSFAIRPYVPEWERYGGEDVMPDIESLFHADSEFALRALAQGPLTADLAARSFMEICAGISNATLRRCTTLEPSRRRSVRLTAACEELHAERNVLRGKAPILSRIADRWTPDRPPFEAVFRACFHMHCNRFGLTEPEETIALNLLNRLVRRPND